MVINTKHYLNSIAAILKVKFDEDNIKKECGITSTIFELLKKSKTSLGSSDPQETAEIQQYIEYALVFIVHADNAQNTGIVLKELNEILALKTYLVGNRQTIADVFIYYIIFNIMDILTNQEKEKYLNVCRWFDNIQQDSYLRQSNKFLNFNTNYLATLVPAKH